MINNNREILKKVFGFYSEELDDIVLYFLEKYSIRYMYSQSIIIDNNLQLLVFLNGEYVSDNISKIRNGNSKLYISLSITSTNISTYENKYDTEFYKELNKITNWLLEFGYRIDRNHEVTTGYRLYLSKKGLIKL